MKDFFIGSLVGSILSSLLLTVAHQEASKKAIDRSPSIEYSKLESVCKKAEILLTKVYKDCGYEY